MAWLTGWDYRQKLTLDTTGVLSSDVTNDHVILVKVDSTNTDFWSNVDSAGADVRITSSDGTTLKTFHFELFDNGTEDMVLWFKGDDTFDSSSDTEYYLYYSNSGASDAQNESGTYPSTYRAVYHMGDLLDSTTNNYDGTAVNSPSTTTGRFGDAYSFNGSNQYWTFSGLMGKSNDYTLIAHIKSSSTAGQTILHFGVTSGCSPSSTQFNTNSSNDAIQLGHGCGSNKAVGTTDITDGSWHMVIGTYTSGQISNVWVDGSSEGSGDQTGVSSLSTGNDRLAVAYASGSLVDYWNGLIDEFKVIYYAISTDEKELLSASEQDTLITFGSQEIDSEQKESTESQSLTESSSRIISKVSSELAQFDDGDSLNLSIVNSEAFNVSDTKTVTSLISWVAGKYNKAISFNGLRKVTIPYASDLELDRDAFTICAWVYMTSISDYPTIISKISSDDTTGWAFRINTLASASKPSLTVGNGTPRYVSGSTNLSINNWYHLAVSYSLGTATFYINGSSDGNASVTGGNPSNHVDSIYIGQKTGGLNAFNGRINDVLIFDEALDATQIGYLYAATGKVLE